MRIVWMQLTKVQLYIAMCHSSVCYYALFVRNNLPFFPSDLSQSLKQFKSYLKTIRLLVINMYTHFVTS